jgi:hypothetical protein
MLVTANSTVASAVCPSRDMRLKLLKPMNSNALESKLKIQLTSGVSTHGYLGCLLRVYNLTLQRFSFEDIALHRWTRDSPKMTVQFCFCK